MIIIQAKITSTLNAYFAEQTPLLNRWEVFLGEMEVRVGMVRIHCIYFFGEQ